MPQNNAEKKIKSLLPKPRMFGYNAWDGVKLKADDFKHIIRIINTEPQRKNQHELFSIVTDFFFGSRGYFMGVMDGRREQQLQSQRTEILSVMRMMKRAHMKMRYTPGCVRLINSVIREYGGHTLPQTNSNAQQVAIRTHTKTR